MRISPFRHWRWVAQEHRLAKKCVVVVVVVAALIVGANW